MVFKMPWAGDPRVNLQDGKDGAKPYQVRQLLAAIDRLEASDASVAKPEIKEPAKAGRKKDKRHG